MILRSLLAPNGVLRWREEGTVLSDKYYGHYFDAETALPWLGGISWTAVAADCRVVVVFAAAYGVSRFIMPNARHDSRLPGRAQQNEIFERDEDGNWDLERLKLYKYCL